MPARWFDAWWTNLDHVAAAGELATAQATAHGQAMVHAGENAVIRRITRELHRRAFPTVWHRKVSIEENHGP